MGVDFGHFRGTSGVKIKNLFEKMTKLSYKLNNYTIVVKE